MLVQLDLFADILDQQLDQHSNSDADEWRQIHGKPFLPHQGPDPQNEQRGNRDHLPPPANT